jgi:hypothetical protein
MVLQWFSVLTRLFDINVDYTELSGLAVHWTLGHPPEDVWFALDFGSSKTVIYNSDECPAFVSCYDGYDSITVNQTPVRGSRISEMVWAGSLNWFREVEFSVLDPPGGTRTTFRDVGGVIGCNPYSSFFKHKTVELFAVDSEPVIRLRIIRDPASTGVVEWMRSSRNKRWQCSGALDQVRTEIVLDFTIGSEEIVVPETQCDIDRREFHLQFRSRLVVVRDPYKLTCSGSVVVIGALLLQSVRGLVLDFRSKSFGLIPKSGYSDGFFFSIKSLVPLFTSPAVSPDRRRIKAVSNEHVGQLVLKSRKREPDGPPSSCWRFLRINPLGPEFPERSRDIIGPFSSVDFKHVDGEITWDLKSGSTKTYRLVRIIFKSDSVDICAVLNLDLSAFVVPASKVFSDPETEVVCPVCMENIKVGERVQELNDCIHLMHEGCAHEWINRNPSCPICRTEVQRKPIITDQPGCILC